MLTIAVLSDIHSNYVALERCLGHALNAGADSFIFLGDYVGDCAYPTKTLDMLYSLREKYRCIFLKGNREDYVLNYEKEPGAWKEYDSTTGVLYYTYWNLRRQDMDFFKSLPFKGEFEADGLPRLTLCHGSPQRVNEKLLPGDGNTLSVMERDPNGYILCGHTHVQGEILLQGGGAAGSQAIAGAHEGRQNTENSKKAVLNAGSVGMPLYSGGKAQYMLLRGEGGVWQHEFVSLEYDVDAVIADLHSSGLSEKAPYWCTVSEKCLRTGDIDHGVILGRAMELCKEKLGDCRWPDIPEECWAEAVREMEVK